MMFREKKDNVSEFNDVRKSNKFNKILMWENFLIDNKLNLYLKNIKRNFFLLLINISYHKFNFIFQI